MEFRLLGPLEAREEQRPVPLGPLKQRILLALLLLNNGRVVPTDRLIEALWGECPPAGARGGVQAYVSKLRRALGPGVPLVSRPPGYAIELEPERLDLEQFERLVEEGRARLHAGEAGAAVPPLTAALGLWRGPALADLADEQFAQPDAARLDEARLAATEDLIEARLALGRHAELVGELEALVAEHPLRERLRGQLMLALYASGRQAEALAAYREGRRVLVDELGIEPGRGLQELHERMLRQDPALEHERRRQPEPAVRPEPAREERKLVTVVFAELAAGIADRRAVDPERMRAVLAPHEERARAELERFGGTVDRSVGSALVAVFGAPLAHEDNPERAVRAALRLMELAREVGRGAPELDLGARTGVATGEALVTLGPTEPGAGVASGEVVATALRLQQVAPPGAVLVDEATVAATRRAIEYQDAGLAGLRAWRTCAERPEPRPRTILAPFVGREHELALLERLHRTVLEEARPRLVTIVGEAGVGKTRLVDELVDRLRSQATVHRGRCLSHGEGITYWALREILWDAAGIRLDDPAAAASRKLRTLAQHVPERVDPLEANRVACALAITAGIALLGNPLEGMSPESVAEEVGLAWPRLLSALAAERPAVVVVEDLHWAEAPLLDMLELILARAQGPLLIVTTARPELVEARPRWGSRPAMSQLGLEPLTAEQSRELVEHLLPGAGSELHESVLAPSEGNPFFTEEIVRHVADSGATGPVTVPDTVRALLAARIDALPDAEKRTLQDAAVVGRSFWVTTLESAGSGGAVRETLLSLEERGLVITRPSSSLPGQVELMFRHALTREVAYRSIPRARRSRAHARVGGWLEQLAGDRRAEFVELLAHHFEAAASPEDADLAWPAGSPEREEVRRKAVSALLSAGHASRLRLAPEQALRFADRALALAANDAERLAALELRGRTFHAAVRGDESMEAYLEAIELARALGDHEALSRLRSHALLLCTRYMGAFTGRHWREQAAEMLEGALAAGAGEGVSFESGAVQVASSWGMARWRGIKRDPREARRGAMRAVEIAEEIESSFLLAHALEGLTWITFEGGLGEAGAMGERLLRAAGTTEDRVEAHESLVVAAICFGRAGEHDQARAVAAEATRQAANLSPHRRLHAAAAETVALAPAGHLRELLEATGPVMDLVAEEGERTCATGLVALSGRVFALFESGDREATAEALDLLSEFGPISPTPRTFGHPVAELLRPAVGLDEARRRVAAASGPSDTGSRVSRLRAELPLLVLGGDWDALDARVAEARTIAGPACAPALLWIADWAEAARLAKDGHSEEAAARALAAATALEERGERYTAARLLADLVPLLGDAVAEPAAARLEEMGALASLAEVRGAAATA